MYLSHVIRLFRLYESEASTNSSDLVILFFLDLCFVILHFSFSMFL